MQTNRKDLIAVQYESKSKMKHYSDAANENVKKNWTILLTRL